jgi:choline transport protein
MAIFSNEKAVVTDTEASSPPEDGSPTYAAEAIWGETRQDIADMKRLGKKQEFKVRDINLHAMAVIPILDSEISASSPLWDSSRFIWPHGNSFWCKYPASPSELDGSIDCDSRSLSVGLLNGGFAGLFWTFLGTVTCYATIVASLAEMESM